MTFLELRAQFEKVEEDWESRLKALSYEELEYAWLSKPALHRKGMAWMIEYLNVQIFEHLVYALDVHKMKWEEKLFYLATNNEKLELINMRIEELKTYFKKTNNRNLNPAFYLDYISGARFPHFVFNELPNTTQEKIMEKAKNDLAESDIYFFVYDEMPEFNELNASIIEFMHIKTLVNEFSTDSLEQKFNQSGSLAIVKNPYPEIFTEINAYLLVDYTIQEYRKKEKIGPALVTKLLGYFKDEDKIFEEVKFLDYKNFLKKEYDFKLIKLDDRTAPSDHEIRVFKNIEKNFLIEFDLIS